MWSWHINVNVEHMQAFQTPRPEDQKVYGRKKRAKSYHLIPMCDIKTLICDSEQPEPWSY